MALHSRIEHLKKACATHPRDVAKVRESVAAAEARLLVDAVDDLRAAGWSQRAAIAEVGVSRSRYERWRSALYPGRVAPRIRIGSLEVAISNHDYSGVVDYVRNNSDSADPDGCWPWRGRSARGTPYVGRGPAHHYVPRLLGWGGDGFLGEE